MRYRLTNARWREELSVLDLLLGVAVIRVAVVVGAFQSVQSTVSRVGIVNVLSGYVDIIGKTGFNEIQDLII